MSRTTSSELLLLTEFLPYSLRLSNSAIIPTAYRQPITYNFTVAREFLKQVYLAERLQPPTSASTWQNAYSTIWSRARNPAYYREIYRTGEYAKIGVYALEAYGICKARCQITSHRCWY